ncbi:hypothetical protein [Mesorhizobium sp. AA22]|uniref:hypothetical protein n=1 Tax=Mesorhizobium sp. AA22 TaxID=1854057 RepID=UPI0007ED86B7|nr:hypothetical protein [Mesorhizobium sp. AA22]QIA21508.1 hypothetical protein A9K68_006595 [Mesorhizobium sp. AA22]
MTTLAAIKRVLAQLSPEQRARLQMLVESQSAPEPKPEPMLALVQSAKAPAAPRREVRDARLIDWRPLPPRPKPYDPLGSWR